MSTPENEHLKNLYQKGLESFERGNYDYAVQLFEQVLNYNPEHLKARYYLRNSGRAKLKQSPPSAISFTIQKSSSSVITAKARALEHKGQTEEAIKQYEKALKHNPNNEKALQGLANCFENLNLLETAIETLEEIRDINPDNTESLSKLGRLYLKTENHSAAQDCFEKVLQSKPDDMDAARGLKNLAALGTIQRGGWNKETSFRDKILDKTESERLEKEERTVVNETDANFLIEETKKQVQREGETASLLRKLAGLQIKTGQLEEALETYQKLKNAFSGDTKAEEDILNLKLKITDNQLEKLNTQDTEKKARLQNQKQELQLESLGKRVFQFPNDLSLRYEYGKMLLETSKTDEAISHLQSAVNDPGKRTTALNLLGIAFKNKGILDLALTQFKKALSTLAQSQKQTDLEKEIIYNLAQTYEEMGNAESAVEEYKKIYESDITYKDVAKKIEAAYKKKSQ
ncbi:MAG: tetratricopeptide repeat protein [Candidatus Omnitrophota bacterium]